MPPAANAPELPRVLALASAPPEGEGDVSAPFEVIRAGKFMRGGKEIDLTPDDLDAMVSNFERWRSMGAEAPVDYDHSFFEGGESRAAGWFTELVRKGQSLFARVRWTAKAAELIRSREYRFFSPEWTPNFTAESGASEGPTMIAGALTNRPFLRGMTPVALSADVAAEAFEALGGSDVEALAQAVQSMAKGEAARPDETRGEVAKEKDTTVTFSDEAADQIRETLGLEEGAELSAEAIAEAAKEKIEAAARKPEGKGDEPAADGSVTMTKERAEELEGKAGKAEELEGKVKAMSNQIGRVEQDLSDQHFNSDFSQAQREGRVDAKTETRQTWRDRYEKFGREDAKALLFELPAETIPVTERGRGGEGESATAAPSGTDAAAHELDEKVQAYRRDHTDVTYTQALEIIEAEVKSGAGT